MALPNSRRSSSTRCPPASQGPGHRHRDPREARSSYLRERLNQIYSERTGQPIDRISRDTDRDTFMSPDQAKEYGLIDEVLSTRVTET